MISGKLKKSSELLLFTSLWWGFLSKRILQNALRFENAKGKLTQGLYKQRGRFARPFVHSGMGALAAVGIVLAPVISDELPGRNDPWQQKSPSAVLGAATEAPATATLESEKPRDKVLEYSVQDGDTVSSIAGKFGVSEETILWQNDLTKKSVLKPGHRIEVLPVTGVIHKVQKGETIYSIAKKYQTEPQGILDFPFNTFVNDETFALAVGQTVIVPEGTPPAQAPAPSAFARRTPDAGTVTASGSFIWPASGNISQRYSWYHKAIDISNKSAPEIIAADAGTVTVAGWPSNEGYGNRVIVDHGNGYETLYAHMAKVYVSVGQRVKRGDPVGQMGSTGRSTGVHLHLEVRKTKVALNPLEFLK